MPLHGFTPRSEFQTPFGVLSEFSAHTNNLRGFLQEKIEGIFQGLHITQSRVKAEVSRRAFGWGQAVMLV